MDKSMNSEPKANAPRRRMAAENNDDEPQVIDADLDEFFEENDAHPGDRRRDPLRR